MTDVLDPAAERQLAVDLFNRTWTLLDMPERSAEDDVTMIHMAHASRHHWAAVGGPENLARGEWQCSRVYAALGRAEPARYHAERCLAICEANAIGDWDLAYAYEALARAAAVAGDADERARWLERARAAAQDVADPEDREHLEEDLATV
ncbi:MAG TPA: hypothetical protein VK646_14180 [Actinomycetota bacterium]|nr:hypothetical protein [Actinomycetota bacterium]